MMNSSSKDFGTFKISGDGRVLVKDAHLLELVRQESALAARGASSLDHLVIPSSLESATKRYNTL